MKMLEEDDPEVAQAIWDETDRQAYTLELIASENFVSESVLEAMGSVFTNKYAEGYPGRRYYGGCDFCDVVESLAIERAKKLFGAEHANVQSHSGTQANMEVYFSMMEPGDTMLGMNLTHGGHLSHGHPVNFSGKLFNVIHYGVDSKTETIDYQQMEDLSKEHKPKLIVLGASAYSRDIDYQKVREIADKVGAMVVADIAHVAGMVAVGLLNDPVPHCEFITSTTHKTLRGPRGGLILCQERFAKDIDRAVFPGYQGGPLVHIIAAKAVCFKEALSPEFKQYQVHIMKNAKAMAERLKNNGFRIVSGGTDNHLMLVDVFNRGITGKDAEAALGKAGITVNRNTIPFDTNKPFIASGIRIGTPALTTRGMKEPQMELIADLITRVLQDIENDDIKEEVKREVHHLCDEFPLYQLRLEGCGGLKRCFTISNPRHHS